MSLLSTACRWSSALAPQRSVTPFGEFLLWVRVRKTNWDNYLILVLGNRVYGASTKLTPHKVVALWCMPPPTNITEVKRFMEMMVF